MGTYKVKQKNKKTKFSIFNLPKIKTNVDLAKYDPITGEKIALDSGSDNIQSGAQQNIPAALSGRRQINKNDYYNLRKIKMETMADALQSRKQPVDLFEAIKNGTVGTTAGVAIGNILNTSNRAKGLLGIGLGGAIAAMDVNRQLRKYNNQMAAREALIGQPTDREKAYMKLLKEKYSQGKK